jgi:NhaP-type Na+/H+ or K+/H+ antiporter
LIVSVLELSADILGGPAFGIACGIVTVLVFNLVHNELEVEIISTFGLAYLVFYVADVELGVSAVLALVVMGLFMAKHKYCISSHVHVPMANTWRIIVEFANILIFIITGIILAQSLIGTKATIAARDIGLSILLYVALHVGRLLSVLVLYPFIRWSGVRLSWREHLVLIWSGLRGSMSVILALMVDSEDRIDIETRHRFLFHICMITLLTLIINGTSSKFLVRLLGLDHGTYISYWLVQFMFFTVHYWQLSSEWFTDLIIIFY